MGKIAKNYAYNLVYHIFILIVPLITAPYLARVLGPTGTGIYGYVNSMTSMICTFVLLGIYNYGNRQIAYVRDDPQKLSETFWQIMNCRLIIAVLGSIVYFSVTMIIGKYKVLFILYYTYMLAYFLDPTWLFVGVEDMKWALLKNILTKIIAVAGIFLFVKTEKDVEIYILIQGSSFLIANVLSFTQINRYVGKPKFDFSRLKHDILNSALLFLPSVGTTIYTQCDKIMIELMRASSNEVAFYDYSEKIVTIPLAFISAISTVMMPRIANEFKKGNEENITVLLNRAAKFSLMLALPLTFGLIAISGKLVPWYLGDHFTPTIKAIMIIAPIIISNTLMGISGSQYFTATNQIRILVVSQFVAAGANIIINLLLIPQYGFVGAAVATLITSFAGVGIQYYFMLKQIKLPGLLRSFSRYFAISIIMCGIIAIMTNEMKSSPLTTIIQIGIGLVVFFIIDLISGDKMLKELVAKGMAMLKQWRKK